MSSTKDFWIFSKIYRIEFRAERGKRQNFRQISQKWRKSLERKNYEPNTFLRIKRTYLNTLKKFQTDFALRLKINFSKLTKSGHDMEDWGRKSLLFLIVLDFWEFFIFNFQEFPSWINFKQILSFFIESEILPKERVDKSLLIWIFFP